MCKQSVQVKGAITGNDLLVNVISIHAEFPAICQVQLARAFTGHTVLSFLGYTLSFNMSVPLFGPGAVYALCTDPGLRAN